MVAELGDRNKPRVVIGTFDGRARLESRAVDRLSERV